MVQLVDHPGRDRSWARAHPRGAHRHRGVLWRHHEHVISARGLSFHEPDHVHPSRRPDSCLEGRRLLRSGPVAPAEARYALAPGRAVWRSQDGSRGQVYVTAPLVAAPVLDAYDDPMTVPSSRAAAATEPRRTARGWPALSSSRNAWTVATSRANDRMVVPRCRCSPPMGRIALSHPMMFGVY